MTPHRTHLALLLVAVALAFAQPARGGYLTETVTLDVSNELGSGAAYGTVKVEAYDGVGTAGGGLKAGEVRLTFSADPTAYDSVGAKFGLHTVGFNTDLSLAAAQIVAPAGWKLTKGPNLSEYGTFSWKAATSNQTTPTLVLVIESLGLAATPDHFLQASSSASGHDVDFAAHIKDFVTSQARGVTSHWVGGSQEPTPPGGTGETPETPEPAALALGGLAVGTLLFARRLRQPRG